MRHHFARDLGEAGEAPVESEEPILVDMSDVAGVEPAVLDDLGVDFRLLEVALEDIGPLEPDATGL